MSPSNPHSSSSTSSAAAAAAAAAAQMLIPDEITEALATLQLPHMPPPSALQSSPLPSSHRHESQSKSPPGSAAAAAKGRHQQKKKSTQQQANSQSYPPSGDSTPTIRILVVADIDLPSASALAEYTLQQRNQVFDATRIDLCIACGSFTRETDLMPYLRGKQRRKAEKKHYSKPKQQQEQQQQQQPNQQQQQPYSTPTTTPATPISSSSFSPLYNRNTPYSFTKPAPTAAATTTPTAPRTAAEAKTTTPLSSTPFCRTRDQTAALEGLMTAALSQLESIVCRVVYCPGITDPLTAIVHNPNSTSSSSTTTTSGSNHPRRFTPNSRNLHQQWLPLAPGIGCAALFYLDSCDALLHELSDPDDDNNVVHVAGGGGGGGGGTPYRRTGGPKNYTFGGGGAGYGDEDDLDGGEDYYDEEEDEDEDDDIDDDEEEEDEDDEDRIADEDDQEDEIALWCEQIRQFQQSSNDYCMTLERLLKLAPKPQHPLPFKTPTAQSILVTHYVDCQPPVDDDTDNVPVNGIPWLAADKEEHEDKPWPGDHDGFLNTKSAQHLLCLEIASGSAARHKPELIHRGGEYTATGMYSASKIGGSGSSTGNSRHSKSTKPILLPGSLRERGEFCIVDLALEEHSSSDDERSNSSGSGSKTIAMPSSVTASAAAAASSPVTPVPVPTSKRTFAWRLNNVDFHKVNRFPRQQ